MSPKHSAAPVTHENSQLDGRIEAKTKIIIKRKDSLCTWCWTSGDILDTFSCFTVMLLTNLVARAASLASEGGKQRQRNWDRLLSRCFIFLQGCFKVILLHRLAANTYLLLLAFDPPSVPSIQRNNSLLICRYTLAAFWGIRLWSCTAFPTHLSEGRRGTSSALSINQAGWQKSSDSVELGWLTGLLSSLSLITR